MDVIFKLNEILQQNLCIRPDFSVINVVNLVTICYNYEDNEFLLRYCYCFFLVHPVCYLIAETKLASAKIKNFCANLVHKYTIYWPIINVNDMFS